MPAQTQKTSPPLTTTELPVAKQVEQLRAALREQAPADVLATFDAEADQFATSNFEKATLPIGALAPEFSLMNAVGKQVSLRDVLAKGPAIVTFYRGVWCPYCNVQLHAFQGIVGELRKVGATLIAISPQTVDASLSTKEKSDLDFEVLSDPGNAVARRFGATITVGKAQQQAGLAIGSDVGSYNADGTWELPVPATFVIDRDGRVTWAEAHADYRVLTEPKAVLMAVQGLATSATDATTAEVVGAFLSAFTSGDIPGVLKLFDADLNWYVPGDPALVPWAGQRKRDDMPRFFSLLAELTQPKLFEVEQRFTAGTEAIVLGRFGLHFPGSGRDFEGRFAMHLSFRGGRIIAYRIHEDSLALARAFTGLPLRQ